jgi:hypothetical protein
MCQWLKEFADAAPGEGPPTATRRKSANSMGSARQDPSTSRTPRSCATNPAGLLPAQTGISSRRMPMTSDLRTPGSARAQANSCPYEQKRRSRAGGFGACQGWGVGYGRQRVADNARTGLCRKHKAHEIVNGCPRANRTALHSVRGRR